MAKISIIMPIYNAQNYLRQAIDSVLSESYHDYELIAINDGSSDKSLEILETYSNDKLRVISQINGGVSKARNKGLSVASGEYIMFLDADDLLISGSLSRLADCLDGSSLLFGCSMYKLHDDKPVLYQNYAKLNPNLPLAELRDYLISAKDSIGVWACWRHLYKKSFLDKYQIVFDEAIGYSEDMDFILKCLDNIETIKLYTQPFIYYRIYSTSVSGIYSYKSAYNNMQILIKWLMYFECQSHYKHSGTHFANKLLAIMAHISHLSPIERRKLFKVYQENEAFLRLCSGKFKLVYWMIKLIGYQNTAYLLARRH